MQHQIKIIFKDVEEGQEHECGIRGWISGAILCLFLLKCVGCILVISVVSCVKTTLWCRL